MIDRYTLGYSGWRGSRNLGELVSGDYPTLLLLTNFETMIFELEDEGSVYDVCMCSGQSRLSST